MGQSLLLFLGGRQHFTGWHTSACRTGCGGALATPVWLVFGPSFGGISCFCHLSCIAKAVASAWQDFISEMWKESQQRCFPGLKSLVFSLWQSTLSPLTTVHVQWPMSSQKSHFPLAFWLLNFQGVCCCLSSCSFYWYILFILPQDLPLTFPSPAAHQLVVWDHAAHENHSSLAVDPTLSVYPGTILPINPNRTELSKPAGEATNCCVLFAWSLLTSITRT